MCSIVTKVNSATDTHQCVTDVTERSNEAKVRALSHPNAEGEGLDSPLLQSPNVAGLCRIKRIRQHQSVGLLPFGTLSMNTALNRS